MDLAIKRNDHWVNILRRYPRFGMMQSAAKARGCELTVQDNPHPFRLRSVKGQAKFDNCYTDLDSAALDLTHSFKLLPVKPDGRKTPPKKSPWGSVSGRDKMAEGIFWVDTPSHGGFWISQERLARVPEPFRDTPYSPGPWFEEDEDFAIVVLTFPDEFKAEDVKSARATAWHAEFKKHARKMARKKKKSKKRGSKKSCTS